MTPGSLDDGTILEEGRRVLEIEAASVAALTDRVDHSFVEACRLLANATGRVLCCGVGKSGHIARKIAGTLTSTGTPAIFLHPVEALHGDLGIVGPGDVAILVSKSGDVAEVGGLVAYLGRVGVPIVGLVGAPDSRLAEHSTVVLDCSVEEEACPMDLAPTSSTTATLAMGDALAIAVLRMKGFRAEDFAALHPGGALGRKLSLRVGEIMISDGYPALGLDATMKQTIAPLAEMRGTVPIVDEQRRLVGVLTAGDLTRLMERDPGFLDRSVADVMTREPKTASAAELGSVAVARMERHGIMALPVIDDDGVLEGVVHLHDLMRSGAV